jgi:hypothetical protein
MRKMGYYFTQFELFIYEMIDYKLLIGLVIDINRITYLNPLSCFTVFEKLVRPRLKFRLRLGFSLRSTLRVNQTIVKFGIELQANHEEFDEQSVGS